MRQRTYLPVQQAVESTARRDARVVEEARLESV